MASGNADDGSQGRQPGRPGSEAIYSPPWENGFDVCFSTESKVPTYDPLRNPPAASRERKRGVPDGGFYGTRYWTGPGESVPDDQLRGDDSKLIMDRAIPFLASAVEKQQPFLAVIWFHAPHTPVVADEAHRSLYPDHPHGLYGQHYHGCITAMDEQIGRLRTVLDDLGIAGNTMLWYCADNGPESSATKGAGSPDRSADASGACTRGAFVFRVCWSGPTASKVASLPTCRVSPAIICRPSATCSTSRCRIGRWTESACFR